MKIVVPSPEIELYEEGFEKHDQLGRAESGKQLSSLIERVEDPLVIAVDGEWGSGKSFFLKCWVGAHKIENGGSAETIYFDAFRNDFLDDPLLSLTSIVAERLGGTQQSTIEALKDWAAVVGKPTLRVALAAASAGGTEIAGAIGDAAIKGVEGELKKQIDELWKQEASRRAAMANFRKSLSQLTLAPSDNESPRKIVIVVDELDRCRPDYALSVLETIKHFFDVPHVHFVLGVNLKELANSVKARYGDTDASGYLNKFISLRITLADRIGNEHQSRSVALAYFEASASAIGIEKALWKGVYDQLERAPIQSRLSLRLVEKLLSQIAISSANQPSFSKYFGYLQFLIPSLLILKVVFPEIYALARTGKISVADIQSTFDTSDAAGGGEDHFGWILEQTWRGMIDGSVEQQMGEGNFFGTFSDALRERPVALQRAIKQNLETVHLIEGH